MGCSISKFQVSHPMKDKLKPEGTKVSLTAEKSTSTTIGQRKVQIVQLRAQYLENRVSSSSSSASSSSKTDREGPSSFLKQISTPSSQEYQQIPKSSIVRSRKSLSKGHASLRFCGRSVDRVKSTLPIHFAKKMNLSDFSSHSIYNRLGRKGSLNQTFDLVANNPSSKDSTSNTQKGKFPSIDGFRDGDCSLAMINSIFNDSDNSNSNQTSKLEEKDTIVSESRQSIKESSPDKQGFLPVISSRLAPPTSNGHRSGSKTKFSTFKKYKFGFNTPNFQSCQMIDMKRSQLNKQNQGRELAPKSKNFLSPKITNRLKISKRELLMKRQSQKRQQSFIWGMKPIILSSTNIRVSSLLQTGKDRTLE